MNLGFIFALLGFFVIGNAAESKTVQVRGLIDRTFFTQEWDHADLRQKITKHPLIGSLACPSLFRFNPQSRSFDSPILESVQLGDHRREWVFKIKSKLSWWSGDTFDNKALATYLETHLATALKDFAGEVWKLPAFEVTTSGLQELTVKWKETPAFGPYILSSPGVMRKRTVKTTPLTTSTPMWECLGERFIEVTSDRWILRPRLVQKDLDIVLLASHQKDHNIGQEVDLDFRHAASFAGSPWLRMSDENIQCPQKILKPVFSVIAWNSAITPTNQSEFRKILTNLSPRGELLRAGGGNLGDIVSAPISRQHWGYDNSILVHPFKLSSAAQSLDQFGYKRPEGRRYRVDQNAQRLSLNIKVDEDAELLKKVLADAFAAVGIELTYNDPKRIYHGYLAGIEDLDGSMNFLSLLHRDSKHWFGDHLRIGTIAFDQALEAYGKSLSHGQAQVPQAHHIHKLFSEHEVVTTLAHKYSCAFGNLATIKAGHLKNAYLQADWLLKALL